MEKETKIILGGIAVIVAAGAIYYFFFSDRPDKVITSDITISDYNDDANTASAIFQEMLSDDSQSISANNPKDKTNQALTPSISSANGIIGYLTAKWPQLQVYINKFKSLNTPNKLTVATKGSIEAFDKTKRQSIALRASQQKQPVWLIIIQDAFQGY